MYSILSVDDEKWIRRSLKHGIERTGLPFTVIHECSNGLEALDWLRGNEVDLVITDVRMPVMDGLNLVRELHDDNKDQEIVIISGYDDFVFIQTAMRLGVKDYLLKPVEMEDMAVCLGKVLERLKKQSRKTLFTNEADRRNFLELSSIEQVIQFVKESMPKDVTLNDAAAKVHLNPSYLSQMFKQKTKVNFGDYVLNLRMEEAKKLLSQTSLRITEISERLGYTDVSYFGNAFKRVTGQTPSQFRKIGENC